MLWAFSQLILDNQTMKYILLILHAIAISTIQSASDNRRIPDTYIMEIFEMENDVLQIKNLTEQLDGM